MTDHVANTSAKADPFDEGDGDTGGVQKDDIHIRIQQRNGRKTLTTIQGISQDYDLKLIIRAIKKEFHCNGTVVDHPEYGEVLQLQGDQRLNIRTFFTKTGLADKSKIKMHGF